MRSPIVRLVTLAASSAVLFATVGACTSDEPPTPAAATSSPQTVEEPATTSSRKPSTADTAKARAKEAYVGMWQAMARAGRTSDWKAPELSRYATGNALTTITRSLYADHYNKVVTRGAPKNSPHVTSADPPNDPTTVMISDCGDSTGTSKVMEDSGKRAPGDVDGGRRSITAEVVKQQDGTWRVKQFAVEGVGTC